MTIISKDTKEEARRRFLPLPSGFVNGAVAVSGWGQTQPPLAWVIIDVLEALNIVKFAPPPPVKHTIQDGASREIIEAALRKNGMDSLDAVDAATKIESALADSGYRVGKLVTKD